MKVFRIADARHPVFDATGSSLYAGRWHSRGNRVIYGAATYAGALLEQLAHANMGRLPKTQAYVEIEIPDGLVIERVGVDEVPGWEASDMLASRARGDEWYKSRRAPVLMVPSAVTLGIEWNVLLSQVHPDFGRIEASGERPVKWDPRLVRK